MALPKSQAAKIGSQPYHCSASIKMASISSRAANARKPSMAEALKSRAACWARMPTCSHTARTSNRSANARSAGRCRTSHAFPKPTSPTRSFMFWRFQCEGDFRAAILQAALRRESQRRIISAHQPSIQPSGGESCGVNWSCVEKQFLSPIETSYNPITLQVEVRPQTLRRRKNLRRPPCKFKLPIYTGVFFPFDFRA